MSAVTTSHTSLWFVELVEPKVERRRVGVTTRWTTPADTRIAAPSPTHGAWGKWSRQKTCQRAMVRRSAPKR